MPSCYFVSSCLMLNNAIMWQFWEMILVPSHLDDQLWLSHFRLIEITLICWLVQLFSHMICWGKVMQVFVVVVVAILRNLFGKCVSVMVHAHVFLSGKQIRLSWVHTIFMSIFRMYAHLGVSSIYGIYIYPKICIKMGGWMHS